MEMKLIRHGSKEYEAMVQLRQFTLLDPIGVPPSFIVREKEVSDGLIGGFAGAELIACCILTEINRQTVQLRQMAVHPQCQGSGMGAAVLLFAEEEARKRGYSVLMMHARAVVRGFYEKNGYRIEGPQFLEV